MARYQISGRDFICHLCQGIQFADRKVKLNTTGMSFFDLDWLNKSADGLICESCGYVHLFMKKGVVEEIS